MTTFHLKENYAPVTDEPGRDGGAARARARGLPRELDR
jgi:hypothetical protein